MAIGSFEVGYVFVGESMGGVVLFVVLVVVGVWYFGWMFVVDCGFKLLFGVVYFGVVLVWLFGL